MVSVVDPPGTGGVVVDTGFIIAAGVTGDYIKVIQIARYL
jgi:hypothetical protein